eukprot:scaffold75545_cov31-Tisochrysis_lutea.AAC.2
MRSSFEAATGKPEWSAQALRKATPFALTRRAILPGEPRTRVLPATSAADSSVGYRCRRCASPKLASKSTTCGELTSEGAHVRKKHPMRRYRWLGFVESEYNTRRRSLQPDDAFVSTKVWQDACTDRERLEEAHKRLGPWHYIAADREGGLSLHSAAELSQRRAERPRTARINGAQGEAILDRKDGALREGSTDLDEA